jgi:homoserine O-acetyltransferase
MSSARKYRKISGAFPMSYGQLIDPVVAYETWGTLAPGRDNAVLLFTGMSPGAHAASSPEDPSSGWWEDIIGPDQAIDTARYHVICVNSLGSCFGSTGPSSTDPKTGESYGLTFPALTLEDIAHAAARLLDALGIDSLFATVGASMGGMTALAFTMLYPSRARGLLSISSAERSLPFSIALRALQRELICQDPAWQGGSYPQGSGPREGMRLARKLGLITYRSPTEWNQRFGRERILDRGGAARVFGPDFEVEGYLDHHARRFVEVFDANSYLYLSRAIDVFDVSDHGGKACSGIACLKLERALVIGVETDLLFPPHQQRELAESLRRVVPEVSLRMLPSPQGHDSFLVDMERFRPAIASFF